MMRLLLVAAFAAAVAGLQVKDDDDDVDVDVDADEDAPADETLKDGMVAALDPELTNSALEKFHVTQPGEYVMIGKPSTADPSSPETSELMVFASFEKLTAQKCEDVLIRKVTIQGTRLGSNLKKIEFTVKNDIFNSTGALGLSINQVKDGKEQTLDGLNFSQFAGYTPCVLSRPRGYIKVPNKHSWRRRSRIYSAECNIFTYTSTWSEQIIVTVHWSTVWRGLNGTHPVYANDLSFSMSNVGKDSIGLLGTDDHTEATKAIPGCNKAQPVAGPFQTRTGPKHPKKWRR